MCVTARFGSVVLLALLGAAGIHAPAGATAAQPARVLIQVSPSSPRAGQMVTVDILVRNAADVGSIPFTLHFDPSTLELALPPAPGPKEGKFLSRDGSATSFLTAPTPQGAGPGLVVGLSRLRSDRGARGKGVLCTFSFRAKAAGVGHLGFSNASILNPHAEKLPATFSDKTIKVRPAP